MAGRWRLLGKDGWVMGGEAEVRKEEEEGVEEEVGELLEGLIGTIVFSWRWKWTRYART